MVTQGGADVAVLNLLELLADPQKSKEKILEFKKAEQDANNAQKQAQDLLVQAKKDSEAADKKLKDAEKLFGQAAKLADEVKKEKTEFSKLKLNFDTSSEETKSKLSAWQADLQEREEKLVRDTAQQASVFADREAKLAQREASVESERKHYASALNNLKVIING